MSQAVKLLSFEDGEIKMDGQVAPGILASLRVDGKVRFDQQKTDGKSGKSKTPNGFEDTAVTATMYLMTDEQSDCYDKLAKVNAMFRDVDGQANPKVFDVTNRHLVARGVRKVVFSRLESAENDQSDEIRVTLGFVEHNPPIVKVEKAKAKTPTPKELAKKAKDAAQSNKAASGGGKDPIIVDAN